MTVAFTGYRPEKMPFQEDIKNENYIQFRKIQNKVISELAESGYSYFISGIAQGFDTWVAEDILKIKESNINIKLECAIPYPDQAKTWTLQEQERRYNIISRADYAYIICEHYSKYCFFIRNKYMVDKADVIVCAFDGQNGGTKHTVDYALKQNKTVIQINPTTFQITTLCK